FPIAQDVLGYAQLLRQFADGLECARVLGSRRGHAPDQPLLISSRMIWLARKVITRRGAIGTSTPVLGLRPTRWPLSRRMNVPKPDTLTLDPLARAWHMWCSTRSTTFADSARDSPSLRCTMSARSA